MIYEAECLVLKVTTKSLHLKKIANIVSVKLYIDRSGIRLTCIFFRSECGRRL